MLKSIKTQPTLCEQLSTTGKAETGRSWAGEDVAYRKAVQTRCRNSSSAQRGAVSFLPAPASVPQKTEPGTSQVLSKDWTMNDSLHPSGVFLGLFLKV